MLEAHELQLNTEEVTIRDSNLISALETGAR
jgi:hypothetical protein